MDFKNSVLLWFLPEKFKPNYALLKFAAEDKHIFDSPPLYPISNPKGVAEDERRLKSKYSGLLEEATRLADRESHNLTETRRLFINIIQFGLIAAGVTVALSQGLEPWARHWSLFSIVLSIAFAWWFVSRPEHSWDEVLKIWHDGYPEEIDGVKIPKKFHHYVFEHFYERIYFGVLLTHRKWLQARLSVPIFFFIAALLIVVAGVRSR